jgi:cytoskeletal protein CcmA (bactofilin family)
MFGNKTKHNELLRAKINTLVGEGTTVDGVINFEGGLHVVGVINGGAVSDDDDSLLIISENALIKGDIKVNHLIVNGQIDGNVYASGKVELFDKAHINGDVYYSLLELPVGAEVNGKLIRIESE